MRELVSPRWAWSTVVAVAVVAVVFVVFRLGNQASAGVALDDPVVWLEDGERGEILQVNGATREITARVPVGERGDALVALPRDRDAVFLNRTTGELGVIGAVSLRVDSTASLEPVDGLVSGDHLRLEADFAESVDAYVIDDDLTLVVEPGAGIRLPIPTPEGIGSTVVDRSGRLLAVTVDGRRVGITNERGLGAFAELPEPITDSENRPLLARAGGEVYVIDLDRRTVNPLQSDGSLGITTCVAGSLSNVRVGGSPDDSGATTPYVLVHDPVAGVLSVSEPNRSECYDIPIEATGDMYGNPVMVDGIAYLPNWGTGRIEVVDLEAREVMSSVAFASRTGVPFELEVFHGAVWANEPLGPFAGVVTPQGIEPIRKIGRVVIDETIAAGDGPDTAILAQTDEGQGRVFSGDSGDPVTGGNPGGTAGFGGTGGDRVQGEGGELGSGPLTDGTGLLPDEIVDAPVGVVFDDVEIATPSEELQANFTFSAETVNVGEEVTFTDTSTGDPISWNWDFGDGTGAEGFEVVKAWDGEGVYTVKLFIADADGNQAQQSLDITVVAADVLRTPVANFRFRSDTIEVGEPLAFESVTSGEADLLLWQFGDGNEATGDTVEHTWAAPGTYTVTLTATNAAGSDSTSATITVVEGVRAPEAIIGAFPTVLEVGQSVELRSESTNSPTLIEWDLGDGTTALGSEIRHAWRSPGTFRVRLTVANSAGSSTTFRDVVIRPRVDPPVARFGESSLEALVGQPINFTDLSQNNPTSRTWEFGDGATATGANVSHTWSEPRSYTVTLTVSNEAGDDEVSKTVTILPLPPDPPAASFTVSSATVPSNAVVRFTDTSTNDPTEWSWDFGDGATSRAQSPPHAFADAGTYTVTLTASNAGGSTTTSQTIRVIDPPIASFEFATDELTVDFGDTSTNNPTSWWWDFGDGDTSNSRTPTKTYDDPGTYEVSLIASNETGTSSPAVRTVTVARRPRADFEHRSTGLTVVFEDRSSRGPTSWSWDFGDGNTSNVESPTHTYDEPGDYDVRLTVSNVAGEDSEAREISVDYAPPVADFDCEVAGAAAICDGTLSSGAVSWSWDAPGAAFIEGEDTPTPIFTYDESGVKEIELTVSNQSGQTDSIKKNTPPVIVPEPPEITDVDVVSNEGGVVELVATATNSPTSWRWRAPDAVTISGGSTATPTITFDEGGRTNIFVSALNDVGESDEVRIRVNVNFLKPPVITGVDELSNEGGVVELRGQATNNPDDWLWDIDGGTIVSGSRGPRPTIAFAANGTYDGTVRARNDDGPSDPFPFTIVVTDVPVPPVVTAVNEISNSGGVVELEGVATNSPTGWDWSIPGGSITSGANSSTPRIVFGANGTYSGSVTASNGDGDSPPFPFTVVIDDLIDPPQAQFSWENRIADGRIKFFNESVALPSATHTWDFGSDDAVVVSGSLSPVVDYPAPGEYEVSLTVTDAGGTDTFTDTIVVDEFNAPLDFLP